jgi:GNAT superfamily N-acetyltransferase
MFERLRVADERDLQRFVAAPDLPALDAATVARAHADAAWLLLAGDAVVARCSLWWTAAPRYRDHRVGLLGHYGAVSEQAAAEVLRLARAELARQGCTLVIGPMDGSTSQRYRFVTERGAEPPFFLEPENPDAYPQQLASAGFTPLAEYYSSLQDSLEVRDPRLADIAARLAAEGVGIRPLDLDRFDVELRRIYTVVAPSFSENFLATPIAEDEFIEQYAQVRPFVQPELVLLAEREGETVGFMFVLPDWLQAQRGEAVSTVIVKTLAVAPAYAGQGLATLLSARAQDAARQLGYTRAIHALMHERNTSRRISSRFAGRIIRRYTLFARPVAGTP